MTRARLSAQRTRREALEARTARVVAQTRVGSARVVSSTVVPTPAALAQTLPAEGAQAAAAVLRLKRLPFSQLRLRGNPSPRRQRRTIRPLLQRVRVTNLCCLIIHRTSFYHFTVGNVRRAS